MADENEVIVPVASQEGVENPPAPVEIVVDYEAELKSALA